jgi:hypothetical protein
MGGEAVGAGEAIVAHVASAKKKRPPEGGP